MCVVEDRASLPKKSIDVQRLASSSFVGKLLVPLKLNQRFLSGLMAVLCRLTSLKSPLLWSKVDDSRDGARLIKQGSPVKDPASLLHNMNVSALPKKPKPCSSLLSYCCWHLSAQPHFGRRLLHHHISY